MNNHILKQFAKGQQNKLKQTSKKAVIYTRVSSKEQADGNNSLQWQLQLCNEYANKNGYEIVSYFGGTHESAKTEDRKQYKAMLDFVKKSKDVASIIVYSMDRFGRSGAESITVIETLRKSGVYVLSVTQPVDQQSQSGKMMTDFQLMLSKWDNDTRRQKTVDGMRNKLLRGDWCGNVPTGYAYDKTSNEQKIIFSEKAKYIKQAFKMKLGGKSNPEIIKALKSKGYTIPLQLLSDTFRNVFYCGLYSHNLLNGELIKGKQPCMITEKEFALINGMLKSDGFKQKKYVDALPLKSTGRCADCDLPLTGYLVVKKNIYYYKCRKRGCKCNVSAKSLHSLFLEQLNQFQITDKNVAPLKRELVYVLNEITKGKVDSKAALKKSIYDVQGKLVKAEERHAIGDVSREVFERVRGKLLEEKAQFERELEKIGYASSNHERMLDFCIGLALKPASAWSSASYDDKLNLQRTIFPRGFGYDKKNHRVRTTEPNVIFQLIKAVSDNCEENKNGSSDFSIKTSRLVPETGLEPVRP
jgi:DNA invertase Pin-like site-specific DNA recombinase